MDAKKQAIACQEAGMLFHGNMDDQGQNTYSNPSFAIKYSKVQDILDAAETAMECWYWEGVALIPHNYEKDLVVAGHFTQLVWKATREVAMAVSDDGKHIVANYYPQGNMMMIPGEVRRNVLPPRLGVTLPARCPHCATGHFFRRCPRMGQHPKLMSDKSGNQFFDVSWEEFEQAKKGGIPQRLMPQLKEAQAKMQKALGGGAGADFGNGLSGFPPDFSSTPVPLPMFSLGSPQDIESMMEEAQAQMQKMMGSADL